MAVTNDNIGPPINIQNRRNKQSFDTYAFTIDIVPLVLEKTCFAGHTFEYKWKINKTKQKGTTESVKPRVCFSRIFRDVGRQSVS